MSSEVPLQIIATEQGVRELANLSDADYSDEQLEHALEYGSAIVRRETGVKTWDSNDPQYPMAVEAANMFAASILFPRTKRDEMSGNKSYYRIYQDNGYDELKKINLAQDAEADGDYEYFMVINSKSKNYYQNPEENEPFMAIDGFMGKSNRNNNNPDTYSVETL